MFEPGPSRHVPPNPTPPRAWLQREGGKQNGRPGIRAPHYRRLRLSCHHGSRGRVKFRVKGPSAEEGGFLSEAA